MKNEFITVPWSGVLFSFANEAHEIFYFEFCVVKFSSFGLSFDGLWNKEWQEPKLGDDQVTQGKIQGQPKA